MLTRPLILASSSPYRSALLARLGLEFSSIAPEVDESQKPGEAPAALAARLAAAKARAAGVEHGLVIGSDQVPELDGEILRKPGNREAALRQLIACQGRSVSFHTALCVADTARDSSWEHIDKTVVRFADLDTELLERYVDTEKPFDCAGGFRAEGLGIVLFTEIQSSDPTALIGLPLIALARILRVAGADPLSAPPHPGERKL